MWHGVDFLARCIRRLATEEADWIAAHRLHFLLVGDGLKMPEVSEILAAPAIAPHVTLTGLVPQAQAPAYLALSDVFLSPHVPNPDGTPFFGSPTKLFEYMAMGKPIVAADLDQIGAVLRGTHLEEEPAPEAPLAALFPPGDEDGFIAALKQIVEAPEAARATGARAREAALRLYTWDKHVGAILARMRAVGLVAD
jgi:glycosyltransferase involved in cell wall biosynthesis